MKNLIYLFALLFLTACGSDGAENSALLGKWEGISWKVNGQESNRSADAVKFEFQANGSYTAALGAQSESGTFNVKGNKLYTTAEGQVEKMVKVTLAAPDTMEMDMNRVGTPEVLTLVRR